MLYFESFRLSRVGILACALMLAARFPAFAGEVDLEIAGCAQLPEEGRFMSIHLVLDAEGNGRDCVISAEPKQHCEQFHSFDEGFLCLGLTHNPRPDITAAEKGSSMRVDRLIVDGEEILDEWGKTILRKDFGTGPSGENYEILVEQDIFGTSYSLIAEVSATPDGPVKFTSVRIIYD